MSTSNWRNAYRIGGLATPTGDPCAMPPSCSNAGFVETEGLCADHYESEVLQPLEEQLKQSHEWWLAASATTSALKRLYKCSCGLVTDLFTLNDKHLVEMPTHHQVYDRPAVAPREGSKSTPSPKATPVTAEEIG